MHNLRWLRTSLQRAAAESGRSVSEILKEMAMLRLAVGRMGTTEYFDFRLYMGDLSLEEKKAFAGRRGQTVLNEILVDEYSEFLSMDKPTMYSVFRDCGFPIPGIRALYATCRPSKAYSCLKNIDDLRAYLTDPANLPVYIKPSCGSYGRGNTLIAAVDGDDLVLGNGSRLDVQRFCESLAIPNGLGWILQEPLQADPAIAALCGDKISGVRISTFNAASGPQIHRAIWKINIGTKDSDNFQHGGSGNMLGQVDTETGTIVRVIAGIGFDQKINPTHPVTGEPLRGFVLPHWNEVRRLVTEAALAFPGFLCPGWDIAICPDGPKVLEVNSFGDIDLSQHAYRRGFMDPQFIGYLRSRGLDSFVHGRAGKQRKSKITSRMGSRRQLHWNW
jgi:hypothetical protein